MESLKKNYHILGADFMFIIGKRYENMRTDTRKSWRHVPLFEYLDYENDKMIFCDSPFC